ncbi:MAG: hypothetical protein ABL886_03940 [Rhodoglobus sp.]
MALTMLFVANCKETTEQPPVPEQQVAGVLTGPTAPVAPFSLVRFTTDRALPEGDVSLNIGGFLVLGTKVDASTVEAFVPDTEPGQQAMLLLIADQRFEGQIEVDDSLSRLDGSAYLTALQQRAETRLVAVRARIDEAATAEPTLDWSEARAALATATQQQEDFNTEFAQLLPDQKLLVAAVLAANAEHLGIPQAGQGKVLDDLEALLGEKLFTCAACDLSKFAMLSPLKAKIIGSLLVAFVLLKNISKVEAGLTLAGRLVNGVIRTAINFPVGRILTAAVAVSIGALIGYTVGFYRQISSLPVVPSELLLNDGLVFPNDTPFAVSTVRATYRSITASDLSSIPALRALALETQKVQEGIDFLNNNVLPSRFAVGPLLRDRMVRIEKAAPVRLLSVSAAIQADGTELTHSSDLSVAGAWMVTIAKMPEPTADLPFSLFVELNEAGVAPLTVRAQATLTGDQSERYKQSALGRYLVTPADPPGSQTYCELRADGTAEYSVYSNPSWPNGKTFGASWRIVRMNQQYFYWESGYWHPGFGNVEPTLPLTYPVTSFQFHNTTTYTK